MEPHEIEALASLVEKDRHIEIQEKALNSAWQAKITINGFAQRTLLQHAAELGSSNCFALFGEAMCQPLVWSGFSEGERGSHEIDFFYAVSTYFTCRFMLDGDDRVAIPFVRRVCEAFFRKDDGALILAKRNQRDYEKFGAAFEQARNVFAMILSIEEEKAQFNEALNAAAPSGVKAIRL